VVLAIIAAVVYMVTGRGESDAYSRQVADNEAAQIRFFIDKGFARARASNEPVEVVASGHSLLLRGARSGTVYDTLETHVYTAATSGVTSTLFPSGAVTGGNCTLSLDGPNSVLRYAIQPGGLIKEVRGGMDCPTLQTVAGLRPSLPTGSGGSVPDTDPPPPPPPTDLDPPPPPPADGQTGSLRVNIDNPASTGGEPEGDLELRNDSGVLRTFEHDALVPNLSIGTYTIRARPITIGGCAYEPDRSEVSIGVLPNDTSVVTVAYRGANSRIVNLSLNGYSADNPVILDRKGGTAVLEFRGTGADSVEVVDTPDDFSADLPTTINDPGDLDHEITFGYAPNMEPQQRNARISLRLSGCGTSDDSSIDILQEAGSAPLTLAVSGLPNGVTAPVHIESSDTRCANSDFETGNDTIDRELPATCQYKIWGERVHSGGNYYDVEPTEFELAAYEPHTADLAYQVTQGYIEVEVSGLPAGSYSVDVNVTGPVNEAYTFPQNGRHTFTLPPGSYSIAATPQEMRVGGVRYVLDDATRTVDLEKDARTPIHFAYKQADALVTVRTTGLPSSEQTRIAVWRGSVNVTNFNLAGGQSRTLALEPGEYVISASASRRYYPVRPRQQISVASGQSYSASFAFRRKTGTLRIQVDHHKAWADGVGTVYGDADSYFEHRDFVVPTGTYVVKGDATFVYKTTAPQYRYRLISPNNQRITVARDRVSTATMDYIVESRDWYCVLWVCWWTGWSKVGD